jgi:O-phosphoseryl-tRNA(Cys) synthetase
MEKLPFYPVHPIFIEVGFTLNSEIQFEYVRKSLNDHRQFKASGLATPRQILRKSKKEAYPATTTLLAEYHRIYETLLKFRESPSSCSNLFKNMNTPQI